MTSGLIGQAKFVAVRSGKRKIELIESSPKTTSTAIQARSGQAIGVAKPREVETTGATDAIVAIHGLLSTVCSRQRDSGNGPIRRVSAPADRPNRRQAAALSPVPRG